RTCARAVGLLAVIGLLGCADTADMPFLPTQPALPFFMTDSIPMDRQRDVPTAVIIDVGLSDVPFPPDLPGAWSLAAAGLRYTGFARADLVDRRGRVPAARGLQQFWQYTMTLTSGLHPFARGPLKKATRTVITGG